MAVKDVFRPPSTNPSDPTKPNDKEDKTGEWEKKAREAKAEREYEEEQQRIKRIAAGGGGGEEPAFQVKGAVKLDIDPQRDAERARQELKEQQEKSEQQINTLAQELEKTKDELRTKEITAAMEKMSTQFQGALKEMNDRIAAVKSGADPSVLSSQFQILTTIAEQMGFQKPSAQVGDPRVQLEITKLEMDNARAEREFKEKMEQNRRDWDLQLERLRDDRDFKKQQLAQEEKKNEMFIKAPQVVGGAIAQGILASRGKAGSGVTEEVRAPKKHHIEAGFGESGEVRCPSCGRPIAIGPTARVAVCTNCNERIPIKRGEKLPVSENPEPEEDNEA